MKAGLKTAEGLTVSVGVAPNKSIAKMASDMNKPDGLTVVRPEQVRTFLDPLPVNKISGVGKKTTEYLQEHGIQTIGQLSQIPAKKLTDWFGKGGVWLWGIANGIEETPVEERGLRKSISVEQTFERDVQNKQVVLEALCQALRPQASRGQAGPARVDPMLPIRPIVYQEKNFCGQTAIFSVRGEPCACDLFWPRSLQGYRPSGEPLTMEVSATNRCRQ